MLTRAGFRRAGDLLPDPILLLSAEGEVLEVNEGCRRLFATPRAKLIGSLLEDQLDNADQFRAFLGRCARSPGGTPGALRLTAHDQPIAAWGGLVEPGQDGNPPAIMLRLRTSDESRFAVLNRQLVRLNQEIERRAKTEHRLREQEVTLEEQLRIAAFGRDVALAVSEAIEIPDMLQRCAQSMVDDLGASFARVWILEPDSDSLRLHASAGLYTHLDGAHANIPVGEYKIGRIAQTREPHLTNQVVGDPAVHDQEWARRESMQAFAGYPLLLAGRLLGVMAMFSRHELSDTTTQALASIVGAVAMGVHRLRIEADLRVSFEALRRADKSKDEFLAMLSHELRAPLAPMRHALEIIKRGENRPDLIAVLDDQLSHSVRLIDDLLDISRVSQGRITMQLEPLAIDQLVEQVSSGVTKLIEDRDQNLRVSIEPGPMVVLGDRVRLRQVLLNLLQNAIKYTPDGGHIELFVARSEDWVEVRVSDDGAGIDPSFLPQVFDLFAQSERTLDRGDGGLGLGLTLARTLVECHGGEITAESAGVGRGSSFRFRLPLAAHDAQPAAESVKGSDPIEPDSSAALHGRHALVVDDNRVTADTLRDLLEMMGCAEVAVAYEGNTALELARQSRRFDLVILDLGLPGIDGYSLAEQLRPLESAAHATLVALSGYGSDRDRERSREAGFDAHLTKPLDVGALERVLAHSSDPGDT